MKQTFYVDVLVITNIYINYGLLLLTCFLVKLKTERLKILLASLFGGVYSIIIILPYISDAVVSFSRIPALAIMTYIAFRPTGIKEYVRVAFSFLAVNLIFAAALFLLWYFVCPDNMYFNSGVVYFDMNALTLVLLTVGAYAIIRVGSLLCKRKPAECLVYNIEIFAFGESFSCKGFYDTANFLTDPFSGESVTVVHYDVLKGFVDEDVFTKQYITEVEAHVRLIPVKSLSGTGLLPSFRIERMNVTGVDNCFTLENPIIALCEEKIQGGKYGALLNSSVFDNAIKGKGDSFVLHN